LECFLMNETIPLESETLRERFLFTYESAYDLVPIRADNKKKTIPKDRKELNFNIDFLCI
jgi:hypothetical protein